MSSGRPDDALSRSPRFPKPKPELSIAIAGAGIIGLSLAWRLAQEGFEVTVFDQSAVGKEASWAGAGMLSPGGELEGPSPLASMAIESRRLYPAYVRELEDSTGSAIDYQECGGLDVAYSSEELAALDERARLQTSIGIQSRPVSLEQIAAFWPRLRSEGLAGARFYPGDAIVNPREVLSALMTACHRSGVCIVENCGVRLVEVTGERVTLETSRGREQHSAIAIAAGAWSHSIIVEGVPRLPPSEPVKGHLIAYQEAEQVSRTIVRHAHTYLLQRSSGALIVGASVEHVGFDRDVKPEIVSELAEHAAFVLPHLRGTAPTDSWIGFRPGSDALHIGPWHSKRLYLAYGHFRNGILLAPWTARQIVGEVSANLGRH